jgi:hypothetical protein
MKTRCLLLILSIPALARADTILYWNEVALSTIQRKSTPPPVAAWALAMVHVAVYDSVNSIEPTHQSFRLYAPPSSSATSREAAAAQAAFRMLLHLYPTERARLEGALAKSLTQVPEGPEKTAGLRLGDIVAESIITWRRGDGSHQALAYKPGQQPGQWRPTPPDYSPALLPQWAHVKPFGIAYRSQFRPALPPTLDSAEYARDFDEVKRLGAADSAARTEEQTQIAHFWADGPGTVTPPGHWNRIAQTVSRSGGLSEHDNARLFALLNVALADAAIACWDMKFACNLWRPVTAIHEADTDGNDRTSSDPAWQPLLDTPPFPSCTSGHSTFSGAAARMLALFFGRDELRFSDTSGAERITRTYTSFSQAADEAGRSRIYGGIHFEFDNRAGLQSGRGIGQYVFDHYLKPDSAPSADNLVAQTTYRPASNETAAATVDPIVVPWIVAPVLYYEPVVYEYQVDGAIPQSAVTYYLYSER